MTENRRPRIAILGRFAESTSVTRYAGVVNARRLLEFDGLDLARVRRVENRDAVAEHVPDVEVAAVEHDLHAIGPSADVAVRDVPEAMAGALRRNGGGLRGTDALGCGRQSRQAKQTLRAIAPCDRGHASHSISGVTR